MQPSECRVRSQSVFRRSSWCWCVWSCQCFAVSAPGWLNHGALCRCCTGWKWETAPRSPYQYLLRDSGSKHMPSKPTRTTILRYSNFISKIITNHLGIYTFVWWLRKTPNFLLVFWHFLLYLVLSTTIFFFFKLKCFSFECNQKF